SPGRIPWPAPHDVHLEEWIGAFNTFVLICSSLTVVLAHWSLHNGKVGKATQYIGITLVLGCVFLVVKAYEYYGKFSHAILPGSIYELTKLKANGEKELAPTAPKFRREVEAQLKHIKEHYAPVTEDQKKAKAEAERLLEDLPNLTTLQINERIVGSHHVKPI